MSFNQIFPEEIISDILSRLPAESLLECKSVCKTWKNLIEHRSFPQIHLAHLNHPDSADSGNLNYVFLKSNDDYANRVCYFEYNKNEDWNYVEPMHREIMLELPLDDYIVIGSFNGLICVYGYLPEEPNDHGPAVIFNPVTKEYIVLPDPVPEYDTTRSNFVIRYHEACGFGYLAETNEYKVVRMYMVGGAPYSLEVEVYTVGSGNGWRHVGKFDFGNKGYHTHLNQAHGVFLNGCLYWKNGENVVLVFDLADEKFCDRIPPPPMRRRPGDDCPLLGISGSGILYYAVSQTIGRQHFNGVWLLRKKNDSQSWGWSKAISLEQKEPFGFMECGTVLRYDQGTVKYFLLSTSTWENLGDFEKISRQVFPHKHTFISLKELGEEDVKIMKTWEFEETDSSESGSSESGSD